MTGTTEVLAAAVSPWSDTGAAITRPLWPAFGHAILVQRSSPASLLVVEAIGWKVPPPTCVGHRDGRGFPHGWQRLLECA